MASTRAWPSAGTGDQLRAQGTSALPSAAKFLLAHDYFLFLSFFGFFFFVLFVFPIAVDIQYYLSFR